MKKICSDVSDVIPLLLPGDLMFSRSAENSIVGDAIRLGTGSEITHVGIVSGIVPEPTIIEAHGPGVTERRLLDVVADYDGCVCFARLHSTVRENIPEDKLIAAMAFLRAQLGKKYDLDQCVRSGLVKIFGDKVFHNTEDYAEFFCSELVAAFYKTMGLGQIDDASEMTPIDVCRLPIFETTYYQVKGDSSIKFL